MITIQIHEDDEGRAAVEIDISDSLPFHHFVLATEYMMHMVAKKSDAGFERALELLVNGSIGFRDLTDNTGTKG